MPVFRLHAGPSLLQAQRDQFPEARATWGRGSNADRSSEQLGHNLQRAVPDYIGAMPFIRVPVDDVLSIASNCGRIESNCKALLGNARSAPARSSLSGVALTNAARALRPSRASR